MQTEELYSKFIRFQEQLKSRVKSLLRVKPKFKGFKMKRRCQRKSFERRLKLKSNRRRKTFKKRASASRKKSESFERRLSVIRCKQKSYTLNLFGFKNKKKLLQEEIRRNATAKAVLEDQLQQTAQENQGLQEQLKQKLDVAKSPNTLNVRQVDNIDLMNQNNALKKDTETSTVMIEGFRKLAINLLKS